MTNAKNNKTNPTPNGTNPTTGSDKAKVVLEQVEEVKTIMRSNVQSLIGNIEALEVVEEKSNLLRERSEQFKKGAKTLKDKMWWKNVKATIIIGTVMFVIIGTVV
eukprot:CAMPEP_0168563440 /NCGR_PEP_ID=MMETSP0413-20121227/12678_1 /TAXON_ID=136452 /ORGANISM="Filamoeba nolandi, Strain NC-AS-23-1" /LENGTH=104 /DNA_ID=CAMNT_0008594975 /DNA_START=1670 /DNA_END=1981 /DNA_ORIENTATION=+